jgi:zinc transporter 7
MTTRSSKVNNTNINNPQSSSQETSSSAIAKPSSSHLWQRLLFSGGTSLLNISADCLHNFTDGITIGAAFAAGNDSSSTIFALSTVISVIMHDIPHEIGDYAFLLKNGWRKHEAIFMQFLTAIPAVCGTVVGYLLSEKNVIIQQVILTFTAGGFVYIATVSSMPYIMQQSSDSHQDGDGDDDNKKESVLQAVLEVISFIAGVGMMLAVTYLE